MLQSFYKIWEKILYLDIFFYHTQVCYQVVKMKSRPLKLDCSYQTEECCNKIASQSSLYEIGHCLFKITSNSEAKF